MIRLFAFGLPLTFRFLVPVEALKVCWCQTEEKLRNKSSSHPLDSNRKQSGLPGSSLRGCNRQEGIFPAALVKISPQCQLCRLPLIIPIPEIHQELLVHSTIPPASWVGFIRASVLSPHLIQWAALGVSLAGCLWPRRVSEVQLVLSNVWVGFYWRLRGWRPYKI